MLPTSHYILALPRFVIKYKAASGWVDWKKSQLKCKPSTATTQAPEGSSSCQGKCG